MIEGPRTQALRFLAVGSIGFVVDAGGMWLLTWSIGMSPLWARCISFPLALSATWYLNRNWTFPAGQQRRRGSQYALYLLVQLIGLGINFGIFALLIKYTIFFDEWPVLALAIGAGIALVFTFLTSRAFVFSASQSGDQ